MQLITSVEEKVVFEIGHFAESSVANCAPVWPGSIVNVLVGFQVSRGGERFLAQLTLVGLVLKQKRTIIIWKSIYFERKKGEIFYLEIKSLMKSIFSISLEPVIYRNLKSHWKIRPPISIIWTEQRFFSQA